MISASETFQGRLLELAENATLARNYGAADVYREAAEVAEEIFVGRSFGEAVAVLTRAYQQESAAMEFEEERLAWLRAASEVEQLLQDLS